MVLETKGKTSANDEQFVSYYTELICQMERLLHMQDYSLNNERILNLRTVMENYLQRLSTISQTAGHAQQKKAALACRFAHQQLMRFPDYAPKPTPKPAKHRVELIVPVHSWSAVLHHCDAPLPLTPPQTVSETKRQKHRVPVATYVKNSAQVWYVPPPPPPLAQLPSHFKRQPPATAMADYNANECRCYVCGSVLPNCQIYRKHLRVRQEK